MSRIFIEKKDTCETVSEQLNSTISAWFHISENIRENSGISGMMLIDEPSIIHFQVLNYIKVNSYLSGINKPEYVDLYPSYASERQLFDINSNDISGDHDTRFYQIYLNQFQVICSPDIWSADYYCFSYDAEKGNVKVNNTRYFENLLSLRYNSIMTGKPLWWYILTCAKEDTKSLLAERLFRFYAITGLMCGAKGIVEWRVVSSEEYKYAPIKLAIKNLTQSVPMKDPDYFEFLMNVNQEIKVIGWLFAEGEVCDIRFLLPSGSNAFDQTYGDEKEFFEPLAVYSASFCDKLLNISSSLPLLLSRISYENKTYIAIASLDYKGILASDTDDNITVGIFRKFSTDYLSIS